MQKYLVRRFLLALVTLLSVSLIIFIMSRVSGDPRHIYLDDYSTQEDWDRMGAVLGLDKPYYQRESESYPAQQQRRGRAFQHNFGYGAGFSHGLSKVTPDGALQEDAVLLVIGLVQAQNYSHAVPIFLGRVVVQVDVSGVP